jgi:hypothetical protein
MTNVTVNQINQIATLGKWILGLLGFIICAAFYVGYYVMHNNDYQETTSKNITIIQSDIRDLKTSSTTQNENTIILKENYNSLKKEFDDFKEFYFTGVGPERFNHGKSVLHR